MSRRPGEKPGPFSFVGPARTVRKQPDGIQMGMRNKIAFCFVCGAKTGRGYPGGDPENGPAEPRCSANPDHESVTDMESAAVDEAVENIIDNYLRETAGGTRHTVLDTGPQYVNIPHVASEAARVLQADKAEQDRLGSEAYARQERLAKEFAAINPRAESEMLARFQQDEPG